MKKQTKTFKFRPLLVSILAILFGFLVGTVLLLISRANPIECFTNLFKGGLVGKKRIFSTFSSAIPLVFTGLSVTFAYKTGLFNIGATGQMVVGGLMAVITALSLPLPRVLLVPAVVLAGVLSGAIWGGIQGYLKSRFNVNEVVSGIMMNWVAHWTCYYVVSDFFQSQSMMTESQTIPDAASLRSEWLLSMTDCASFNWGFVLAIIAVVIVHIVLKYTVTGYNMRAVGYSADAAQCSGIDVKKNSILAMAIAGALAGAAGVVYYCGYSASIRIGVQPSHGFDGIAVALLGNLSPIGVFFSSIFFAVLQTGKGFMNAMTHIAPEIADTIIAIIIYFAAISKFVDIYFDRIARWRMHRRNRGIPAAAARKEGEQ